MINSTTLRQTFTGHWSKGFCQARSASCLRPHPLLVCVLACECYMHLKTQLLCHSNIWHIDSALRVLPKSKKPKKNPCYILSGRLRVNNRRVVSFSRFCCQQWKKWHSFSQTLLLCASAVFFLLFRASLLLHTNFLRAAHFLCLVLSAIWGFKRTCSCTASPMVGAQAWFQRTLRWHLFNGNHLQH